MSKNSVIFASSVICFHHLVFSSLPVTPSPSLWRFPDFRGNHYSSISFFIIVDDVEVPPIKKGAVLSVWSAVLKSILGNRVLTVIIVMRGKSSQVWIKSNSALPQICVRCPLLCQPIVFMGFVVGACCGNVSYLSLSKLHWTVSINTSTKWQEFHS